jgi:hypothetical protein
MSGGTVSVSGIIEAIVKQNSYFPVLLAVKAVAPWAVERHIFFVELI